MSLKVELRIYWTAEGYRFHFWVEEGTNGQHRLRHVWPEESFADTDAACRRGEEIVQAYMADTYGADPGEYDLVVAEPEEQGQSTASLP